MADPTDELPFLARARSYGDAPAVVSGGRSLAYAELVERSTSVATALLALTGRHDLDRAPVCLGVSADVGFVAALWGIWRAGGMAVPLAHGHPSEEIAHVLDDAEPAVIVVDEAFTERVSPLAERRAIPVLDLQQVHPADEDGLPTIESGRPALMLFTSGTTSRPKGVPHTHASLTTQLDVLTAAWRWSADDRAPLFLPLHHVHGLVNVLSCGLYAGATVTMMGSFEADRVWSAIGSDDVTVLMAVPTVYHRLAQRFAEKHDEDRRALAAKAAAVRLMVSGSAALPVPLIERWRAITGHTLLERYGMTEIGMALSHPYDDERVAGTVGSPLPSVEARVRGDDGLLGPGDDGEGELEVRGPSVFAGYWRRDAATAEAFTEDGWFRTGDRVRRESGRYTILGRSSVDILKTGGFKVSALEVESVLLTHPAIRACAVVGLPHEEWGDEVTAVVEADASAPGPPELDVDALRQWAKEKLAPYKLPRRLEHVAALPRNAMGKVEKKVLIAQLQGRRDDEDASAGGAH